MVLIASQPMGGGLFFPVTTCTQDCWSTNLWLCLVYAFCKHSYSIERATCSSWILEVKSLWSSHLAMTYAYMLATSSMIWTLGEISYWSLVIYSSRYKICSTYVVMVFFWSNNREEISKNFFSNKSNLI